MRLSVALWLQLHGPNSLLINISVYDLDLPSTEPFIWFRDLFGNTAPLAVYHLLLSAIIASVCSENPAHLLAHLGRIQNLSTTINTSLPQFTITDTDIESNTSDSSDIDSPYPHSLSSTHASQGSSSSSTSLTSVSSFRLTVCRDWLLLL
jgi:hypothetical protein